MADTYPPAPAHRYAYDLSGTRIFHYSSTAGSTAHELTGTEVAKLNNEDNDDTVIGETTPDRDTFTEFHFPTPVDIFGVWASGDRGEPPGTRSIFDNISISRDSHLPKEGTWTEVSRLLTEEHHYITWRSTDEIALFTSTAVWALRGRMEDPGLVENSRMVNVHIYGRENLTHKPNQLLLLDAGSGLEIDVYDWNDTSRGDVKSTTFQVQNNSGTHTANSVSLGFDSLNVDSPDSWHEMKDGVAGAWSTSLNLGNLAAGATYANDIHVRVTIASTAGMGLRTNRITMDVTSWTT